MADPAIAKDELPYRPCAGIMLANYEGLVFVGSRIDTPQGNIWQMPQGGIDPGEDAQAAAIRELGEEIGVGPDHIDLIARSKQEHVYDLPDELIGKVWKGRYRGQVQSWFLARFKGEDADINVATAHPEFSAWRWVKADELLDLVVPFKRQVYRDVVAEFRELI